MVLSFEDINHNSDGHCLTSSDRDLWHRMLFLSPYQTPVKELIQQGKFQQNLAALKTLGLMFAKYMSNHSYDPDLVLIPVPVHHNRLIERGYNQSLEIARPIGKALNLEINHKCIQRENEASTQHLLNKQQRRKNTRGVFHVNGAIPRKIAVIDDVFTTGETMRSICSCLSLAGAERIEVWIIARTLKHSSGILSDN